MEHSHKIELISDQFQGHDFVFAILFDDGKIDLRVRVSDSKPVINSQGYVSMNDVKVLSYKGAKTLDSVLSHVNNPFYTGGA